MKFTLRFVFSFLFLAASGSLFSQPDVKDLLPQDPKLKKGVLANGLTYYIRENKIPEKKVELRLVVKVGSIVEDDDQQGLAHMAEHMAFNGTKNFKKNEIVSFLQDIGVGFGSDLNAYTGFDETVYILPIPTDKPGNLSKGFQVLEDWAHQVTYLDEDINNERAIILEESRMGKSGEERMFKKVYPELFKGSKYAQRLPIGVDSIIRNFNPESIRRFYREWYRPNLMAVIIVGDISTSQATELINKHFGWFKNPANPRIREYASVPPYSSSEAMLVTDKEATGYSFSMNYPSYAVNPSVSIDDYRKDLVQSLYTSMLNSRFREISQKENAPFVYAYAGFDSYANGYESFNTTASTGTNDIRKGIDAVTDEIERLKRYGFTASELDRAKKNMTSSYERMWNNRDKNESQDYAEEYIRNFTDQEPCPGIDKEYEYIKQLLPGISLAEINKVTDQYKNQQNRFAYIMGPETMPGITLPGKAEILAAMDAKSKADIRPYEEKAIATVLMSKEPVKGKVISKTKNSVLGTTELLLGNGIRVTLKSTGYKSDQILLSAGRYGGIGAYPVEDKYSAENAGAIISTMGVGQFSPTDLRKALAGKTVSLSPVINQNIDGFRGNSGNRDIETLFQLLNLYVTEPRKDTSLFRSFIQRNKAQFQMMGANPQVAFIDTVYKVLYHNSPLAPTAVPKAENYDKISLDRSLQIYTERLGDLSGMDINIVGSFKEEEIIPLIEKYIASLPSGSKKISFTDNKLRPFKGQNEFTFHKGKEEKSNILVVYSGETVYSPELSMKMSALSEVMNIKIIEDMREKIQGIYGGGTFSSVDKVPYPAYQFVLQLPCGPEKVDTLLKEYHTELTSIAAKGPGQGYLEKVKKQWLEGYRTDMKTNEFWLTKLGQLDLNETTTERFINWEKYVNQLKATDLQSAAKIVKSAPTKLIALQMPEEK
jgi:zinc protease